MPQTGALRSPAAEIAAAPHVREALAPTAVPVPANFHSPKCVAHVTIDQDPFGACVPFSGAYVDAGLELSDEGRQLNPDVLDPLHAYAEIKGLPWPLTDPAQDPSPGMYPTQLWAYTQATGWPTKDGSPRRKTATAYTIGAPSSDATYISDLQQTILQFGPVQVTLTWPPNWFGTDPNGYVPAPESPATVGHAHEVCGWITVNGRLYAMGHQAWGDWEPDIIPDYPNHFYVDVTYWDGLGWETWKVIDVTGDNQPPSPPTVSAIFGVDVSQYQGNTIDWAAAKAAGLSFALLRASVGNTIIDTDYALNAKAARAAGLLVGAYHWLGHGNPTADLDNFIKAIGSPQGLLIALDVEQTGAAADTAADVTGFLDAWAARFPGHKIFVYSGAWFWPAHIGISVAAHPAVAGSWNSNYVNSTGGVAPKLLYPGDTWAGWTPGYGGFSASTILQFTDLASVPGIPGSVDADAFRGTLADLQQYVGGAMGYNQTIKMFSAPVAVHIAAGTTLNTYDPNKPNTVVAHQTFAAETDAHADAEVWVDWQGLSPAPVPKGGPFLRLTDGPFAAGSLIVEAFVTRDPDPVAGQIAELAAQLATVQSDLNTVTGQLNQAKAAAKVIATLAS